jgi:hypothetical protein
MGLIQLIAATCRGLGGGRPGAAQDGLRAPHRNLERAHSGGRPMAKTRVAKVARSPSNRTIVLGAKARSDYSWRARGATLVVFAWLFLGLPHKQLLCAREEDKAPPRKEVEKSVFQSEPDRLMRCLKNNLID